MVWGPHPCTISITLESGSEIRIDHRQLLELEGALLEAKRQVLCRLDSRDWHEVDPRLAGAAK
jgi:hypothetical protein